MSQQKVPGLSSIIAKIYETFKEEMPILHIFFLEYRGKDNSSQLIL